MVLDDEKMQAEPLGFAVFCRVSQNSKLVDTRRQAECIQVASMNLFPTTALAVLAHIPD